jgi:hypothetical protein
MAKDAIGKFRRWQLKWSLTLRILPLVAIITLVKLFVYERDMEFIAAGPLLPSLVAATAFLMGFLITGVLSDYKEAEKLPGEIAASLQSIADEGAIVYKAKRAKPAMELIDHVEAFSSSLNAWFYRRVKTQQLLAKLREFNTIFSALGPHTEATYINRLKQEQQAIRRHITRIHTIKDTSFVPSGYALAEGVTGLLLFVIVFAKLDPLFESLFLIIPITYLFIYLLYLIRDLDNPFEYDTKGESLDEVSIKEIRDLKETIAAIRVEIESG